MIYLHQSLQSQSFIDKGNGFSFERCMLTHKYFLDSFKDSISRLSIHSSLMLCIISHSTSSKSKVTYPSRFRGFG
jgi:hypothetical protein